MLFNGLTSWFWLLGYGYYSGFGLPARSRFGEGRCLEFGISGLQPHASRNNHNSGTRDGKSLSILVQIVTNFHF